MGNQSRRRRTLNLKLLSSLGKPTFVFSLILEAEVITPVSSFPFPWNNFGRGGERRLAEWATVDLLRSVKNVNKLDHSNPLKMLRPATTRNDEIIHSPDLTYQQRKKKIYLFTTLTVSVFQKSLYQSEADNLQKPI